jgi:hypothetical protein
MRKYLFTAAAALAVAACSSNASAPNTTLPSTPGLTSQSTALSQNAEDSGDVFTQTNSPDGNRVLRYHRLADGHLSFAGAFATGGTGAGAAILGPKL